MRKKDMEAIAIPKGFHVTPEQFEQLAQAEQLARLELTKTGELIIIKKGENTLPIYGRG